MLLMNPHFVVVESAFWMVKPCETVKSPFLVVKPRLPRGPPMAPSGFLEGQSEIKGLGFNHQKMGKCSKGPWISVDKI
jgi:hypothetical protein